jgi:ribosomal biogenesis protein LAS1
VLIDAKLHHNIEKNSTFAIRAVYSTALARFVTGFCDIGQNSVVKRSMYEMAELIGMPEAWVELRHEITHGQIPDLRTLEHCVQASLFWLWDFFWVKLDAAPLVEMEHELSTTAEIRDTLRSYVRHRRSEIRTGNGDKPGGAEDVSRQLLRLLRNGKGKTALLVSLLLEERMLLPSQKQ